MIQIMEHPYYDSKHGELHHSNHGTLEVVIQIMGHFKNYDTCSQSNVHPTCTSRIIFPQQKSVKYTKSPIIWQIAVSYRD